MFIVSAIIHAGNPIYMPLNQTHILNKSPNITICIIFTKIKCLMLLEISANVQGTKKALIAKDFIDMDGDTVSFNDPFFKLWIRRNIEQL